MAQTSFKIVVYESNPSTDVPQKASRSLCFQQIVWKHAKNPCQNGENHHSGRENIPNLFSSGRQNGEANGQKK